jgi:chromosome segregation ATPase
MAMFGFLRKRQPEQPAEVQAFELTLDELPAWFDRAMGKEIEAKRQDAEGMYSRLVEGFSEIKHSLDRLDRARMSGGERVHIAANMIKESFVKKNYSLLRGLESHQQNYRPDYEYFMAFQERGMEVIGGLKASTPKQAILLSRYFKRESEQLVESIRQAEDLLKHFRDFLKTGSGVLGTKERVRGMVRECSELQEELERLDARASGLREEIARSKDRKTGMEKRFLEVLRSRDWNDMNRLSKELTAVREKLRETESRIDTELSSVRRPLKKLEHSLAGSERLSPMQKNTLRDFIRNPLRAIMLEKGEKSLQKCLKSIRNQLEKGRLELKDKDQLKVDELIERLEKDIPELKFKYLELKGVLEQINRKLEGLSALSSSKETMELEIKKMGEEAGRLDEELRGLISKSSGMRENLDRRLRELEAVIFEETQKKVTIRE